MKKTIRLTENDFYNLVQKIIKEYNKSDYENRNKLREDIKPKLNEELSMKGIIPLLTSLMISFNSQAFNGHHGHHSHSSHHSHSHAYSHALRTSMPWMRSSNSHTNKPEPTPLQNSGEEVNSEIAKLKVELSLLRSYLKSNMLSDITSTLDTIQSMNPNNLTEKRINMMCDKLDLLISMYEAQDLELTNGISSVRNKDYEELYKNYQNALDKYNEKLSTLKKEQSKGNMSKKNLIATIIFATGVAFLLIILSTSFSSRPSRYSLYRDK